MSDYSKMYNTLGGFINQHKGQITEVLEGVFRNNEDLYLQYNKSIDSILSGNLSDVSPEVAGSFIGVLTIFSIEKGKFLGLQSLPDGVSNFSYKGVVECCAIYFNKSIGEVGNGLGSLNRSNINDPSEYTSELLDEDYNVLCELIDENSDEEDEQDDSVKELVSQYEDTIILTVNSLMETFRVLFESCYEIAPYGILGEDGIVYNFNAKGEMLTSRKSVLEKVYNIYSNGLKKGTKTPDFTNSAYDVFYGFLACVAFGRRLTPCKNNENIYPLYTCENSDGTKDKNITWNKYSVYLKKQLTGIIERALVKELENIEDTSSVDIDSLLAERYVKRITNCCIISEYNVEISLKLIYLNNKVDGGLIAEIIKSKLLSKEILQGRGVFKSAIQDRGTTRLTIVFDEALYSRVPLFAFQAVELMKKNGKRPSWNNVVLGRNIDDKLHSADFTIADNFATNIVAGSGSGKGVMTLNILAAAIADNIQVMYLDSKPDMSLTMSQIAAKTGHKACSYDSFTPRLGSEYDGENFFNKANIPGYVMDIFGKNTGAYCSISYFKAFQLALLLATLRKNIEVFQKPISGKNGTITMEDLGGEHLAIVVDEFLSASNNFYTNVITTLKSYKSNKEPKERKEDAGCKYANAIIEWESKLSADLSQFYSQSGRKSGMQVITLLQKVRTSTDKSEQAYNLSTFNAFFSNTKAVNFLGRGVTNGTRGTYNLKGTDYLNLIENERNWCQVTGTEVQKPEKGAKLNYPLFKPYLVVNDTNEDSQCMRQLRQVPDIERVIGEYGNANPAVGFEGYIQLLASIGGNNNGGIDIGEKLENTYNLMTNLVHLLGYKGNIDDYLYDYDISTFMGISSETGASAVVNVTKLEEYLTSTLNGQPVNWHSDDSESSDTSYEGDYSAEYRNDFVDDEEQEQEDKEPYQANSESLQGNSGDLSQDELDRFANRMTQSLGSVMNSQEERWREQLMSVVVNLWGKFGDSLPFDRDTYMRASEIAVNEFIEKKKARL